VQKPQSLESIPDPEVADRPIGRRFTLEYKLKIVQAAERCSRRGELAALLRKEGLYKESVAKWRRQYQEEGVEGLKGKKRGPQSHRSPHEAENERLRRENERLAERLAQAELIIEVQKKVARLLEELPKKERDERSS
jgi:transposase